METKTEIKKQNGLSPEIIDKLVIKGDLSGLTAIQKIEYYRLYCQRLGLDPLTQPFKLLNISGREVLYCDRSGTQQLSMLHKVSHQITSREQASGCYIVTAKASLPEGRCTESLGAVSIQKQSGTWAKGADGKSKFTPDGKFIPLIGDDLCNAMMKAETKAKRRATLDLLGLGILDESETETIPGATVGTIDVKAEVVKDTEPASPFPFDENAIIKIINGWETISDLSAYYEMLAKKNSITPTIKTAFTLRKQQITEKIKNG